MKAAVRDEVEWFLRNIELQLDDAALETEGRQLAFYWDTYHVRAAVLGMSAFYNARSGFDDELFRQPSTLVISLASSDWIGPLRLLPPHEAELLNLISIDFGMGGRAIPPGGLKDFLRDLHLLGDDTQAEEFSKTAESIAEAVRRLAGQAEQLFKIVQAIGGTWETRLGKWFKNGHLKLEAVADFDYEQALGSEAFSKLRNHFQLGRPEYPINNFADALALCYLQHLTSRAEADKKRPVPRFFASSSIFPKAVAAVNDANFLTFAVGDRRVSVLRDPDYYIFRATFNPPSALTSYKPELPSLRKIGDITTQLRSVLTSDDETYDETLTRLLEDATIDGKKLRDLIREIKQFWFLDNVWVPYAARPDSTAAANDYLRGAVLLAQDKQVKTEVESAMREAVNQLKADVMEYDWFVRLSFDLEKALATRRESYYATDLANMDVFNIYGLLRFGIPERFHQGVRQSARALLGVDQEAQASAFASFISTCRDAVRSRAGSQAIANALSALWILDLDRHLEQLLQTRSDTVRIPEESWESWMLVFRAAALFRTPHRLEYGQYIVSVLERRYAASTRPEERARLAVPIAYLYFHLWLCKGGHAPWRRHGEQEDKWKSCIVSAISFARQGYSIRQPDSQLLVYALNQYLYYIVEGGSDEEFKSIAIGLADELMGYAGAEKLWQFRYDDTLARYFHRLTKFAKSKPEQRDALDSALFHINRACAQSYGDAEVARYRTVLINARQSFSISME